MAGCASCGAQPRVENPTGADIKLGGFVVRLLCRFWLEPEERAALIDSLQAFGAVTGVGIGSEEDKAQAVYLASAYARRMKRQGDPRGVEARDHVHRVVYCLFHGELRYGRVTPAELRPPHWAATPAPDFDGNPWAELGAGWRRFLAEEGQGS